MESEKRICQNCKSEFVIDASDFEFYEKMKVPPLMWCPAYPEIVYCEECYQQEVV